jgi:hypothetical protein
MRAHSLWMNNAVVLMPNRDRGTQGCCVCDNSQWSSGRASRCFNASPSECQLGDRHVGRGGACQRATETADEAGGPPRFGISAALAEGGSLQDKRALRR